MASERDGPGLRPMSSRGDELHQPARGSSDPLTQNAAARSKPGLSERGRGAFGDSRLLRVGSPALGGPASDGDGTPSRQRGRSRSRSRSRGDRGDLGSEEGGHEEQRSARRARGAFEAVTVRTPRSRAGKQAAAVSGSSGSGASPGVGEAGEGAGSGSGSGLGALQPPAPGRKGRRRRGAGGDGPGGSDDPGSSEGDGAPGGSGGGQGGGRRGGGKDDPSSDGDGPGDAVVAVPGSAMRAARTSGGDSAGETVIWGTNISVEKVMAEFRQFLREFKPASSGVRRVQPSDSKADEDEEDEEDVPATGASASSSSQRSAPNSSRSSDSGRSYFQRLYLQMCEQERPVLTLDCHAMHNWGELGEGQQLYAQLIRHPTEVIMLLDRVATEEYQATCREAGVGLPEAGMPEDDEAAPCNLSVQVRPFNLHSVQRMRELEPQHVDSLVSISGLVIRASSFIPDLRVAHFKCTSCGRDEQVPVQRARVDEPAQCEQCRARHSFMLVHNRSQFADKQQVKLQETPEHIPEGETPHTVVLFAHDDLVDAVLPGDRVKVTGVFRAVPVRPNPRQRTTRSVFRTFLDVVHVQRVQKGRLQAEARTDGTDADADGSALRGDPTALADEVTDAGRRDEEQRDRARAIADDPLAYDRLSFSLAPSVWGMEDVKKGLLLQLVGGCSKDLGSMGRFRGEVNVLLCGDPGTSKSQLLRYVHKLAPRGIYTSGKGSSAVGLTAYVTKDPDTREPVLESGALVLSDRGVCCIDEFDKMNDTTRAILHEVMEQQTVSVAKAGIVCTLNARTSVLASANPVESRYNPRLSVVENIKLPPTILSRFDLIYLVLDHCDPEHDRRLARHIVSLYFSEEDRAQDEEARGQAQVPIPTAEVTQFISYVRRAVQPKLTAEAADSLVREYTAMRRGGAGGAQGSSGRKTIAATPRQLESLVRLAEAHARIRLSETVEADDVREAVRLMHVATQRAATDPRTGTIDMDALQTGLSAGARDRNDMLQEAIAGIAAGGQVRAGTSYSLGELLKLLERDSDVPVSRDEVERCVKGMAEEGMVQFDSRRKTVVLKPAGGGKH